ncbi:hypothetical protein BAQ49_02840 [Bacillus proteolyticus]|uniref:SMODS and SLOG-associating 2TM effector domain-containing protein n=1 Tax=Bacillus proteolyticus TaxID=2026192 RepID=A0AA44KSZ8_9BACI|nr:SLATT domain-containing protein [Bacillus proteolyticus]OJE39922.1 hypothetical protein BAQ49_02840 [Bacillus proteolyticus]
MVQAIEIREKDTGIAGESKVVYDKAIKPDIEKDIEGKKTENGDSTLISEIRELFHDISKSEEEDTKVLNEIKELLIGLTTVESSNNEAGLLGEITYFKDHKVWVTKKTRMESEARMNDNNIFSLFVVNFYTLIVLSLSILGLVISDKEMIANISVLTVISSVALFGISLFISLYGYKEKAIAYKQCYLDLTKIESQCQDLLLEDLDYKNRLIKFNEIKREYSHILEKTDNHSLVDRLVYLKNNKKLNSLDDQMSYYKYKIINRVIRISLFIIPIVALIILFVWK